MKRFHLAAAGVVICALCAACSQSVSPTSPTAVPGRSLTGSSSQALADARSGAAVAVPLRGQFEGTATVTPLDPPFAQVNVSATGQASHLGRFTLDIPHVVNFATRSATGTMTLTAANGDTLTASFTGQSQVADPLVTIVETATVTGGTGRFADASGSFTVNRLFNRATGLTEGTLEGTISVD
jgi:hypothetical protein